MPLDGPAQPDPKSTRRREASPRRWREISAAKQGDCRVCGRPPPNQLHHLVSRAQGGSDTEANMIPLCLGCHALIEARDPTAGLQLASSLDDAEYSYAVERYGESFFERRLRVTYKRL